MKNGKLNLAVCISGGGTTMQEVLRACRDGRLPHVNPALVIASRRDAGCIEKAWQEGMADRDIVVVVRKEFGSPEAFGEAILRECRLHQADLIAQCGFLPRMPSNVIAAYRSMIFNQHPGPLDCARPGFGGKGMCGRRVHHAVLHFASRIGRPFRTEATVHRVTDEVDGGALLGVRPIEIMEKDDVPTLAARVLPHEHALVIETIMKFSEFGGPSEFDRRYPLIRPGEEPLLDQAKRAGISAYPDR